MCMYSRKAETVNSTKIFARNSIADRQFLVYAMNYKADSELAMILPIPTPRSVAEDAVRFIDLSTQENFFEKMAWAFPSPKSKSFWKPRQINLLGNSERNSQPLEIFQVGSFRASFVPTLADFNRLDAQFRLPDKIWRQLPKYHDYGFVVFKLESGARAVHPMAFEFPRRDPEQLFFPTVHVHDGKVKSMAWFDHELYFQLDYPRFDVGVSAGNSLPERCLGVVASIITSLFASQDISYSKAEKFIDIENAKGIVDPDNHIYRLLIHKRLLVNDDIVLITPNLQNNERDYKAPALAT